MPERKRSIVIRLNGPTLLKEILADLHIPLEEIHLVALNGEQVEMETAIIRKTDLVQIFSSVDGG